MNSYTLEEKYILIKQILLESKEKNPIKLAKTIMNHDFISIHGPEHHFIDGGAFLTALHNNGLDFNLESALEELQKRSIKMPGAMCGHWGVCGSVASLGAAFSILDGTGPLSNTIDYSNHMKFTAKVIEQMSEIGGPRCCKRNAFLSISEAISFANDIYKLDIKIPEIECEYSSLNMQCIKNRCPFHK